MSIEQENECDLTFILREFLHGVEKRPKRGKNRNKDTRYWARLLESSNYSERSWTRM